MTSPHPRRGVALLAALLAIALTGALITAVAFRANELAHVARTTTLREGAFADAEAALWGAITTTDAATLRAIPVHGTATLGSTVAETNVVVVRTDTTIYWLVASARRQRGRDVARRRIAISAMLSSDTTITRLRRVPSHAWAELYGN